MATIRALNSGYDESVRQLARSLDCATEGELLKLGKLKPSTTAAWRKRGKGPPYILFGNAYLYPRKGLAEYLQDLVRERRDVPTKAML
jgi:hypothetical protein